MPTAYRTCPLCEATCGLEIEVGEQGKIGKIRGDDRDVFSHGFLCPKGVSLRELHEDPDRIRTPLRRTADGSFEPVSWDEAFAEIDRRLMPIVQEHGPNAVAAYLGNPTAHNLGALLYGRVLLKALGTRSIFSASTVDQYPKQMASALMFGSGASVPVPDLDRTDYLLMLGANPLASNGSLMTAPDARGRLRAIRARGGKLVVVDPRRTRTAQEADEHLFLRPGTDALLLFALIHVLFEEDLVDLGSAGELSDGVEVVKALAADFSPEAVAEATGVEAGTTRRIARELSAAPSAAVYGRIGTTTQEFGTIASWLVDVLNTLTGNLDRPGGAMWPTPAAGSSNTKGEPGRGRGARFGRWASRVRGLGEIFGELPVACLAEEIETPGDDQIRALITMAGNPAVSTPNSERLGKALDTLEFMVSVDIYVNETTSKADVILPGLSPLEKSHYDIALYIFAIRNVANFSAPVLPKPEGALDEWEIFVRLIGIVTGQGPEADVAAIDEFLAREAVRRETSDEHGPVAGRDPDELFAALAPRTGADRLLDLQLRVGPYGDGFGAKPEGLTLDRLESEPHGIDFGPLQPRLPGVLRTASGRIDLAPDACVADVGRLHDALARPSNGLVLIGRRHLRSNNSWMHNLPLLVKGPERCTLLVHPDDAARLGLADGEAAVVSSRAGAVQAPVEVTDEMMPGVVSLPHGWGHSAPGNQMGVASANAGTNSNVLCDETIVEPLSGTAILNGIPVEVAPVRAAEPAPA
jgi:anaerobic selenocysteine-containing dehydrogenase